MKNSTNLKNEFDLIFSIERKLGRENLTDNELNFLTSEASKGTPRQMFNYGYYIYLTTNNEEEARTWFNKALKVMNGHGLLRASGKLAELDDAFIEDSMKFLRRSAWRQNPIAKRMIKFMKENPFKFPAA